MPLLYHFDSDQFKENLMLDGQQHMVSGRLCQYLKGWQLDGVRFLYKHFEKGESCILNDESGLGKVVTVSVFLGAILTNDTTKKCLIVVCDEEYIEGWQFHLSVLTQLHVKVIEQTSDINHETVFLIKWSTLKNIGHLTEVNFDHIIIDNRGEMLNNKFCTGILLRYYENKTSIVISSTDVTADIKLLHILLRLCGRLDRQYTDVKLFEDKFQLPKLKDGVCTKVNLEDYFLKREKVINFCREFRLRRYCHQFDAEFPLVSPSEFKKHLLQWRNTVNSQSSGSVKLLSSSSEKDIDELFKEYFQVKKENKLDSEIQQITSHVTVVDDLEVSDEVVIMSPLLFVSESESDGEGVQMETNNKLQDEVKEEMSNPEGEYVTAKEGKRSSIRNRRKSPKPMKRLTRSMEQLLYKTNLRSRNVPNRESPSPILRKSRKIKLTNQESHTLGKRGRKPVVRLMKDEETKKRLKDKHFKIKENREYLKEKTKKVVDNKISKDREEKEEKEKKKLDKSDKTRTSDDEKKKSKEMDKMIEGRKNAKNYEKKIPLKRSFVDDEKLVKKKPAEHEKIKQRTRAGEKLVEIIKKSNENDDKQRQKKKKAQLEEKNKLDRPQTQEAVKTKTRHAVHENKRSEGDLNKDKSKQTKEENKRNSLKDQNEKQQNLLKTQDKRKSTPRRHVQLDVVLQEAKKFLNNKCNTRKTRSRIIIKSKGSNSTAKSATIIPNSSVPSITPHKAADVSILCPKPLRKQKEKIEISKRGKPLTVYTPLGVHSKSTRAMQRYTRSCPTQNKYMKIAIAQVGINKSVTRRLVQRRPPVAPVNTPYPAPKKTPSTPLPITESPAVLESMQLGQALTPTNGSLVSHFIAPQKNVAYNFPLMLDKDISDTECLISSQNSNNNEIIVLTGSSGTENEMEPPKSTVFRRKALTKPPMVLIPRPSYSKAKSPDLFSTCSDLSLPCSQQHNNKAHFEGFKIFGSELRQSSKQRSCLDILERMLEPRNATVSGAPSSPSKEKAVRYTEDEDAMFEITSNGTFGNIVRVNSNGEISPVRNKVLSTPPISAHPKNRITNYLIGNTQHANGIPPYTTLDDASELLPKTPKRRKSLSGTMKRSPRSLSGGITGGKSQSTKLTQWLIKNSTVTISDTHPRALTAKRRRLELSFTDD